MGKELHTVLGARGAVGREVVKELRRRNLFVRSVTKSKRINDENSVVANLIFKDEVERAISGSSFVYICIGFKYSTKAWKDLWPIAIDNIITVCSKENAKIIFLDNIYMYGPSPLRNPIKENHQQNPISRKGLIRKNISDMLLEAHNERKVKVVIGRSADFYGKNSTNSPLYISFLERMLKGKNAQSLSKLDVKHTYANVSDNGRALVSLALEESAYGMVWHLPTSSPVTFREVNEKFNNILGTNYEIKKISKVMRIVLSLFIPPIREISEMLYQFDNMYILDSHKFMEKFSDFKVTSVDKSLREMVESFS